ncbi:LEA type 2 family protein [Palaeococcus ferrophilus]|uniref:LEA type 2 family protein n=1 Tax=Palaeococcus ferrophilus TaxID=83868 RepID=UPI00064FB928|nr:LEA type 2 family protein [Palaeococcus ferrophilus]
MARIRSRRTILALITILLMFSAYLTYSMTISSYDSNIVALNSPLTLETSVKVRNFLPFSYTIDYPMLELYVNDVPIAYGAGENTTIPAMGSTTVRGKVVMNTVGIIEGWKEHVRSGEKSTLRLVVRGKALYRFGERNVELSVGKSLETNIKDSIVLESANFPECDLPVEPLRMTLNYAELAAPERATEIRLNVFVTNPNNVPVDLRGIHYRVFFNGVEVSRGEKIFTRSFDANETQNMLIVAYVDNARIPELFLNHLQHGEKSEFEIYIYGWISVIGSPADCKLARVRGKVESNFLELINAKSP